MKRKGTSQNREELIKRIQMLTGGRPEYCSGMEGDTPFACKIGNYIVLWNGDLEIRKDAANDKVLNQLSAAGLLDNREAFQTEKRKREPTLRVYWSGLSEQTTEIIFHMLTEKNHLLSKAIPGFRFSRKCMTFPLFYRSAEERKAYQDLSKNLINTAKKRKWFQQKKSSSKKEELPKSDKYAFRVWLNQLGMKGKNYAASRKLLTQNLSGNTVYSNEKKLQTYNQKRKEACIQKNNVKNFYDEKGNNETKNNHNSSKYHSFILL